MSAAGKEPDHVTQYQISRLARISSFTKLSQSFKADLEICMKNVQRKHDCQHFDIHAFFEFVESIATKTFKQGEVSLLDCLELFLAEAQALF